MAPNAVWKPDDDTNICYCCHGIFTFSIRRHHWYVLFIIRYWTRIWIFFVDLLIVVFSRLCGNVVCNSCSRHRQVITVKEAPERICHACYTYLWIRRSGQTVEALIKMINQCLKNYDSKWSIIYTLLDARQRIIKKIQTNPENRYSLSFFFPLLFDVLIRIF